MRPLSWRRLRMSPRVSTLGSDARVNVRELGGDRRALIDLYHRLLSLSWGRLVALFALVYGATNALFALAYLAQPGSLENARPGSFADAFFFSVQTMATIGYGKLVPQTTYANGLVTVEALFGLLGFTIATGLFFTKFARPTARVLFSRVATIGPHGDGPCLMFRMANERSSQIVEAHLTVALVRDEVLAHGEIFRRVHDLELVRSATPVFALTWTAIHRIGPSSPLLGQTAESLRAVDASIVVSLIGIDETFSATVHSRHAYSAADLVWGARLADVLVLGPDGQRLIDRTRFHEVVGLAMEDAPAGRGGGPPP